MSIDPVIAGIVGSLGGAVVGSLISWFASIKAIKFQQQLNCASELAEEFIEVQRLLQFRSRDHSTEYRRVVSILKDHYQSMNKAVLRYYAVIDSTKKERFKLKWDEFCNIDFGTGMPTFKNYISDYDKDIELSKRDKANADIVNMLHVIRLS